MLQPEVRVEINCFISEQIRKIHRTLSFAATVMVPVFTSNLNLEHACCGSWDPLHLAGYVPMSSSFCCS
jgi:hypothetical protein